MEPRDWVELSHEQTGDNDSKLLLQTSGNILYSYSRKAVVMAIQAKWGNANIRRQRQGS